MKEYFIIFLLLIYSNIEGQSTGNYELLNKKNYYIQLENDMAIFYIWISEKDSYLMRIDTLYKNNNSYKNENNNIELVNVKNNYILYFNKKIVDLKMNNSKKIIFEGLQNKTFNHFNNYFFYDFYLKNKHIFPLFLKEWESIVALSTQLSQNEYQILIKKLILEYKININK